MYSYIFETVLCTLGMLLTAFTLLHDNMQVRVGWLPWSAQEAPRWVAGFAITGLICVALAVFGRMRFLLFLFSGAVVVVLVRGFFLSTDYTFDGVTGARNALFLVAAALLAFVGAYPFRRKRPRRS